MFTWVQKFADWMVFDLFKLSAESHLADALNFFIYDSILIGLQTDWQYIVNLFSKNYFLMFNHPTGFLVDLAFMNFFCFIGNLLPIVPLDGGHIWFQVVKKKLPEIIQKTIVYSGIAIVVLGQFWLLYYLMT